MGGNRTALNRNKGSTVGCDSLARSTQRRRGKSFRKISALDGRSGAKLISSISENRR